MNRLSFLDRPLDFWLGELDRTWSVRAVRIMACICATISGCAAATLRVSPRSSRRASRTVASSSRYSGIALLMRR